MPTPARTRCVILAVKRGEVCCRGRRVAALETPRAGKGSAQGAELSTRGVWGCIGREQPHRKGATRDAGPLAFLRGGWCNVRGEKEANVTQQPRPDTLDFIYEHVKGGPRRQLEALQALDGKLINVFAVASVVVSLAGLGLARGSTEEPDIVNWTLGAAVVTYMLAVAAAIFGLRPRLARETDSADNVWTQFHDLDVSNIKHALVSDIAGAFAHNRTLIRTKARCTTVSLLLTGVEATLVGTSLILARVA